MTNSAMRLEELFAATTFMDEACQEDWRQAIAALSDAGRASRIAGLKEALEIGVGLAPSQIRAAIRAHIAEIEKDGK